MTQYFINLYTLRFISSGSFVRLLLKNNRVLYLLFEYLNRTHLILLNTRLNYFYSFYMCNHHHNFFALDIVFRMMPKITNHIFFYTKTVTCKRLPP